MADRHPGDDEVLAELERHLHDDDPKLTDRFTAHSAYGAWPVRELTIAWMLWTSTWFLAFLLSHNPAALVLATTCAVLCPLGLAGARRLRRHRHG